MTLGKSLLCLGMHWSEAEPDVHVIVHKRGFEKEPQEFDISSDDVQKMVYKRGLEKEPQECDLSSDDVQMIVTLQDIEGDTRM